MDKILIFGDSIAYGKWDSKGGWVARLRSYIDETYNLGKSGNTQVFNLGIPGEIVPRLADRFLEELDMRIFPEEKNLVIIACGINDSCPNNWMSEEQTNVEVFRNKYSQMIQQARDRKCEILCIGLTPPSSELAKGHLFTLEEVNKYDQLIHSICKEHNVKILSLFDDLLEKDFSHLLVDAVHPNDEGHAILFEKIKDFIF